MLRCAGIDAVSSTGAGDIASCARKLGARRSRYTTLDTIQDIEALRVALGVDTLAIYGVSYGTKAAVAYARASPARVELLMLDSVLAPDDPDQFYRNNYVALPRIVNHFCRAGACRRATRDPVGDLRTLARRVDAATARREGPNGRDTLGFVAMLLRRAR